MDHDLRVIDNETQGWWIMVDHDLGVVDHGGSQPRVMDYNLGVVDHDLGVADHSGSCLGVMDHDLGVVDHDLQCVVSQSRGGESRSRDCCFTT